MRKKILRVIKTLRIWFWFAQGLLYNPRWLRRSVNQPGLRVADQVRDLVRRIHRGAGVVDDVVDAAIAVEKDGQDVVQLHPGRDRDLEAACGVDRRADVEEAVAAQAPGLVRLDGVGHLVGGVAVDAVVRPGGLVRRVVGQLVLEEDRAARSRRSR